MLNTTIVLFAVFILQPLDAVAWKVPGHMVSGAIAYQIVQRESPTTITKVRAILEKFPWYVIVGAMT